VRDRLRSLWARAIGVFGRSRRDRELQEELASHLDMHVEDNLHSGMSPEEARRAALIKLGGIEQTRELYREQQGLPFVDTLAQDLRLALRMLRKNPSFTVVALAILALGIGANTVMFSVVNALLLRHLPYPDAERLVRVQTVDSRGDDLATAVPDFREYRARNRTFEGLASFYLRPLDLTGGGDPERIRALIVSPEFLGVLRTPPAVGRDFLPREEQWGDHQKVLLTDGFWRRRFAADPSVVGRQVILNAQPFTVLGVLPPGFSFIDADVQALVPMSFAPGDNLNSHNNYFLTLLGRLRKDTAPGTALADLNVISQSIAARHPENQGTRIGMKPLQEALVGDVKPALLVLFGAVAFVLLIVCANLGNLLLARAVGRRREIGLRIAIGATRGRVLRQLLTETVLLALAGGALALGLASASVGMLNSLDRSLLPRSEDVAIDAVVFTFTALVAVLTGLLFGLAPALRCADVEPVDALKEGSRAAGDRRGHHIRAALVVSEVALSLVLLIGAGLMVKSVHGLARVDAGFEPRNVLTAQIGLPKLRYVDAELERRFSRLAYAKATAFFEEVIRGSRSLPGVSAVGAINGLPLMGEIWSKNVTLHDRPLPKTLRELPVIQYRVAAGDYFRALGIPILAGRAFSEADTEPAAKVAIINQEMARRHWKDQDPVGKLISVNPPAHLIPAGSVPPDYEPALLTIVGVAADVRYGGLHAAPAPLVYTPYAQGAEGETTMYLVVRTSGDPDAFVAGVRDRIRQVDAEVPASRVQTMEANVSATLARPRLHALVLGGFAGLALLLAATGIYGVMAHAARQRTREIGIRMAIGASRQAILALFLRQGLALAAAGALLGLLGAALLTRTLQTMLFEVSSTDPLVFATITTVLLAVALAAAWLPARRATRLDPLMALREE
jgi:predicted permease